MYTKNTPNFAVSKSELLVSATEKQRRNNINYYNHHHHPESYVKFTYFHCIHWVGCVKNKLNRHGPCPIGTYNLRQTTLPRQNVRKA